MMNKIYLLAIATLALTACGSNTETQVQSTSSFTYQNPITSGIDPQGLRDCHVFRDGDWWYMTGTAYPHWSRQEVTGDESTYNKGVPLYRSKTLTEWEFVKTIVPRGEKSDWYYRRFWAPEIQKIGNKYYALFNASNPEAGFPGQNPGYAVADNIEGPYQIVTKEKPLTRGNDLTFFEDRDGKVWAFWNRGRDFGIGFAQIDLASGSFLTEPKSAIKPGEIEWAYNPDGSIVQEPNYDGSRMKNKISKFYSWDSIGIEGAYVVENNGIYYLFYSSWTRGYEIGYATASKITGPWTKHPNNPFYGAMSKEKAESIGHQYTGNPKNPFDQIGHNEIFTGPDGRLWLSAHGIIPGKNPSLVIDPIWFDEQGALKSSGPTFTPQTIPLTAQQAELIQ